MRVFDSFTVEGMICAVGMSEPTFYKKESWQYAAENARKAFARTLGIEINTLMADITSFMKEKKIENSIN